ncbi:RagB/SusD family nutrient uptake outer membrane protein [Pedobacter hiemivivus]|uniref:RagB/SusD family nutrient uptake outer membrane protein n=1 Tax=Pedobacter hiemivivus TaxID=2530454 RepID=A0A4U1G6U1_9SPHI|nr:RagB/SusD family nutrient uptake outer membrane protein [Pedobacter hiemivivus]TKC59134.1 RagB/SusD family nutrient uptake outer membrane protein [Pedobacter hiemivivus]
MKKFKTFIIVCLTMFSLSSCKDYLDLVPDNVATLDNAFANRLEAEKYLFTCYSYLPLHQNGFGNIGLTGADELWTWFPQRGGVNNYSAWEISRGNQNVNDPYMNFWGGRNGAQALYRGIRDCNIFLENVTDENKVFDLTPTMRKRWLAEVTFLKAYYHFYLFRMYGPIVLADKNFPVTADGQELEVKRSTVDETVAYISGLLDIAAADLPNIITNRSTELGRVTKPAALMLKAKLWVTAASPLFNGNTDFANFRDKDGVALFNASFDATKWDKAAEACKAALTACDHGGISLYQFSTFTKLSDTTVTQLSIRNSVTEKWNTELVWGLSGRQVGDLQKDVMARLDPNYSLNIWGSKELMTPTLEIANLFYTDKGVPMNEDKTFNYSGRYDMRTASHEERFNLIEGYESASIQYNREPRFYADLGFDGGVWYMNNSRSASDENTWVVKAKTGQPQSRIGESNVSITGLWAKKLVNWKFVITERDATYEAYPWPEMRLSDLYLLTSEALNESGNSAEAISWLDKVRSRAGLKGVQESWTNFSNKPGKYTTKEGLREIIQQERGIELVFENSRFWDLRRWKTAGRVLNQGIHGWSIEQEAAVGYYRPKLLFTQRFVAPRDYLFPLRQFDLIVNPKLVQNPGW